METNDLKHANAEVGERNHSAHPRFVAKAMHRHFKPELGSSGLTQSSKDRAECRQVGTRIV